VAVARDVLENRLICVLVFGSTARGEAREESDVDLPIASQRDRELAYHGSEELTPTEFYRREDAETAYSQAGFVFRTVTESLRQSP